MRMCQEGRARLSRNQQAVGLSRQRRAGQQYDSKCRISAQEEYCRCGGGGHGREKEGEEEEGTEKTALRVCRRCRGTTLPCFV